MKEVRFYTFNMHSYYTTPPTQEKKKRKTNKRHLCLFKSVAVIYVDMLPFKQNKENLFKMCECVSLEEQ